MVFLLTPDKKFRSLWTILVAVAMFAVVKGTSVFFCDANKGCQQVTDSKRPEGKSTAGVDLHFTHFKVDLLWLNLKAMCFILN